MRVGEVAFSYLERAPECAQWLLYTMILKDVRKSWVRGDAIDRIRAVEMCDV